MDIAAMLEKFGVVAVLLLFFAFWAKQREQAMATRLDKQEDRQFHQAEKIAAVCESVTEAVRNNTRVMERAVAVACADW